MLEKPIEITCEDGFILKGHLFTPEQPKAAIMIGPATGIKQQFYFSFAKYLCENGYAVVTYNNRGIGASKGKSINDGNPSLTNWGKQDMTAVLDFLKTEFPTLDYHLVGHSAGGQLIGLMKNALDIKSVFNFASSSGSVQYAKYPFKLKSAFFLGPFIHACNLFFGHTKSQWVGMGEPLPKNVGKEWSRWCYGKGYVAVDLDTKIKEHYYNELSFDSLWVHATDDDIAIYENIKDMIRVFPNIDAEIVTLNPKEQGFHDIGHMKFFSSKRSKLWPLALDWLNKQYK